MKMEIVDNENARPGWKSKLGTLSSDARLLATTLIGWPIKTFNHNVLIDHT